MARTKSAPVRVLVVDDDDMTAVLAEAILDSTRRATLVGRSRHGREALTMAAALNPDVILMDLNMPVMGGVEAIRHLRQFGSKADVLVISSSRESADIERALAAGADGFIPKPLTHESLTEALF